MRKKTRFLLSATHHWKGQVLVCSGSDGPYLYRLCPRTLSSCGCQVRLFYYDVTTQLFLRPLKVYFGSKYQTGFCLWEKGRGGGGGGIKDHCSVCLAPSHFTLSKVCARNRLRLCDVSVQHEKTGCLSLGPQGYLPITPGFHPQTAKPNSQDSIQKQQQLRWWC